VTLRRTLWTIEWLSVSDSEEAAQTGGFFAKGHIALIKALRLVKETRFLASHARCSRTAL
jgi:hypothetical protein